MKKELVHSVFSIYKLLYLSAQTANKWSAEYAEIEFEVLYTFHLYEVYEIRTDAEYILTSALWIF